MKRRDRQSVLFEGIADKPVDVVFDQPGQSSDGGALLVRGIDRRMGLTEGMAAAVRDGRQAGKVVHAVWDLVRERVYGIACGYPDGNDAARLASDPVMKLVCDREPFGARDLASQPTLSRFENAPRRSDLFRMAYAVADRVMAWQKKLRRGRKVRRITIDMDSTCDPTHGHQQLTFFNGYYDTWCYQPMITTIQFDGEGEQWLVSAVLRPGNAKGSLGAVSILRRLLPRLRQTFPGARLDVRMDGGFAAPEVLGYLEAEGLLYVVNLPKNPVLARRAKRLMGKARRTAKETGRTAHFFAETRYKAGRWKKPRRVIVKAEVTVLEGREHRDNPRFVVTNHEAAPEVVYGRYIARGDAENRIKELKLDLRFDLTSCSAFLANQMRNLLTMAASILFQQMRAQAAGTASESAQAGTLRERLVKIGVTVVESVRRILVRGPESYPWFTTWRKVAIGCGAVGG